MENVLILGSKGMLGGELLKVFPDAVAWDRDDVDVTDLPNLKSKILNLKSLPSIIINCVAFNDVDGAEEKKDLAHQLNATIPADLAKISDELKIPLMHFSTNYVFGEGKGEYVESDPPSPQSEYAQSKYQGELEIQKATKAYYIIRTAVLFGPQGLSPASKKSFVDIMLEQASKTNSIKAVSDEINSLTYARDLAQCCVFILLTHQPFGIYHITNQGEASWYDYAKEVFAIKQLPVEVVPVSSKEFPRKATRPKKAVLINTKVPQLRPWEEALGEFLKTV